MEQALAGPVPEETQATCEACAMCAKGSARSTGAAHFFHPLTKCCTYLPALHNFLVGRILADPDPASLSGRASVEARLRKRVAVSPLGLLRDPVTALLYTQSPGAFGKNLALRCPHYLEEGGRCGVWKHRESTCATWFCKHVRGEVGQQFWQRLHQLLQAVEESLALWCVSELDVGPEALRRLFPTPQERQAAASLEARHLDGTVDPAAYRALWGHWAEREEEFFRACAELVAPLAWDDVRAIGGPRVALLARVVLQAHRRLLAEDLPRVLRTRPFQTVRVGPDASEVSTYSLLDPLRLPRTLTAVLYAFDGRPTDEVLRGLAIEQGLKIEPGVIRKLVDFGLLGAGVDAEERGPGTDDNIRPI
jgi:hypothetical protein